VLIVGREIALAQSHFRETVISITTTPSWDTRQLVALLAVVDTGTFSAAALELGYTQSAVSQQVASLERALGAPVFERRGGPRRARLTPVGEALVGHARAVVDRMLAAQADIAAIVAGDRGTLRVGTLQSVGTKVLPRLLLRFRAEFPGIDLQPLEIFEIEDLTRGIESGGFDLSFTPLPVPDGPFAVRRVLDDPFVFLAQASAPEARLESITLRQVVALPLIGVRDDHVGREVDDYLRRTGTEPNYVFRSNDNPTIQGFVAAGLGYAVLPRLTVDEDDPEVAVLPISSAMIARRIGVCWHVDRQLPPTVHRFVDLAVEVCEELRRDWAGQDRAAGGR
jgi:DNA-binding transcriptional LysR family regulator